MGGWVCTIVAVGCDNVLEGFFKNIMKCYKLLQEHKVHEKWVKEGI